jgi:hypothetical protein
MTPYEQIKHDYPEIPIDPLIDLAKRDKAIRNQRMETLRRIGWAVAVPFAALWLIASIALIFGWVIP